MLYWFMSVFTTHAYPVTILPQHEGPIFLKINEYEEKVKILVDEMERTQGILIL